MRLRIVFAGGVLALAVAFPSFADFHLMKVVEVFGGATASPNAQYVVLQMYFPGQTNLFGHGITVFDASGTLVDGGTFTFAGPVSNGLDQAKILIATSEAATFFGVTPNLVMMPVLPLAGGKVCFDAIPVDCVAWGGYVGPSGGVGTPFNAPVGLLRGRAIRRNLGGNGVLEAGDDTDVSSADFSFGAPTPVNNAGSPGSPPASVCGNSTVESLEGCDDGNTTAGDGCSATCQFETEAVTPASLAVDPVPVAGANGNFVVEPGETFTVIPSWRNEGASAIPLTGTASTFSRPGGGVNCAILDAAATYGSVAPDATADCAIAGGNNCYQLSVSDPAVRPSLHLDGVLAEVLSNGGSKNWQIHIGESFTDVPVDHPFYRFIETILHAQITAGCGPTTYCPANLNKREEMAVFLLKGAEGSGFNPAPCVSGSEMFGDVPAASPFCRWIEELARRGITSGCGGGNYCPGNPVTREQMAAFLIRAADPGFDPPPCGAGQIFSDVPPSSPFCKWIEELARRGITSGCGGGNYCPTEPVTRGQMSVFLARSFALALYGPGGP
jgi:cysteine-rich repeat protein